MQKIYLSVYAVLCFSSSAMEEASIFKKNIITVESETTEKDKDNISDGLASKTLKREDFQKNLKPIETSSIPLSITTNDKSSLDSSQGSTPLEKKYIPPHKVSEKYSIPISSTNKYQKRYSPSYIPVLHNNTGRNSPSPKMGDNWRTQKLSDQISTLYPNEGTWRADILKSPKPDLSSPKGPLKEIEKDFSRTPLHRSSQNSAFSPRYSPELNTNFSYIQISPLPSPRFSPRNQNVKFQHSNVREESPKFLTQKNLKLKDYFYIDSVKFTHATNNFNIESFDKFFGSIAKIYQTYIKTALSIKEIEELIRKTMSENVSFVHFSDKNQNEIPNETFLKSNSPIKKNNFTNFYFLFSCEDASLSNDKKLKSFFDYLDRKIDYISPTVYVGETINNLTRVIIYMNFHEGMPSLCTKKVNGQLETRWYSAKESCIALTKDELSLNIKFYPTLWDPEKNTILPSF